MGFPRYRYNKVVLAPSTSVYECEEKVNKAGKFVQELVDQCKTRLPSTEMFDLKNMMDAGVDLEEVNSKVLSTRVINADNVVRKYTKKSVPTATEASDD